MKTLDIVLIIILAICFFVSLYFTVKNKGKCGGNCLNCTVCTEKGKIQKLLKANFGVCSFAAVENKLLNCKNREKLPDNAKSILMFYFPYKVKNEKCENICRYASVPDYHTVVTEILNTYVKKLSAKYPQNKFVCFTDNSPIPEVFAGVNAGIGVIGKNGLLITEKYGSYVFLGEIVTDKYLIPDKSGGNCLNCGLCEKVCPVKLNKELCVSAVTQKKGELTEAEINLIKQNKLVWGCDKCADVCPLNKNAKNTYIKPFISGFRNKYTVGEDISGRAYSWRGEKVINRNAEILKHSTQIRTRF